MGGGAVDAGLEVLYFTDPYCSWCWATEPMLLRLRESFRGRLVLRHVMGGLVKDMAEFYDAQNRIGTTAQVAPHWRLVSERSGQPIDERLMEEITDPHFSTWPACRAVKAAELQGPELGARYLRRLRRAALTERRVISDRPVQLELARQVTGLDPERLGRDLESGAADEAFQGDLALCRRYGATGFPTLVFRWRGGAEGGIRLVGHYSYGTYLAAVTQLDPELTSAPPRPLAELLAEHGPLTTRELAEITGRRKDELEAEAATGALRRREVRGGTFWELAAG